MFVSFFSSFILPSSPSRLHFYTLFLLFFYLASFSSFSSSLLPSSILSKFSSFLVSFFSFLNFFFLSDSRLPWRLTFSTGNSTYRGLLWQGWVRRFRLPGPSQPSRLPPERTCSQRPSATRLAVSKYVCCY